MLARRKFYRSYFYMSHIFLNLVFLLIQPFLGQRTYTKIQMMGVNASCWSWNLCNVLLIPLIFTVCLTKLVYGYSYILFKLQP